MSGKTCVCIGTNIMSGDIVAKTQEGEIVRGPKTAFHLTPHTPSNV